MPLGMEPLCATDQTKEAISKHSLAVCGLMVQINSVSYSVDGKNDTDS